MHVMHYMILKNKLLIVMLSELKWKQQAKHNRDIYAEQIE